MYAFNLKPCLRARTHFYRTDGDLRVVAQNYRPDGDSRARLRYAVGWPAMCAGFALCYRPPGVLN
eukprot:2818673-Lingulodinium_polyedra.AAC.1